MALINIEKRAIHCKIVYYGPGMAGKTTTLQYIHWQMPELNRGELLSIATETERPKQAAEATVAKGQPDHSGEPGTNAQKPSPWSEWFHSIKARIRI